MFGFVDHTGETIVVFGMLSVIMQVLFWSKIVDPVIPERAASSPLRNSVHIPAGRYAIRRVF